MKYSFQISVLFLVILSCSFCEEAVKDSLSKKEQVAEFLQEFFNVYLNGKRDSTSSHKLRDMTSESFFKKILDGSEKTIDEKVVSQNVIVQNIDYRTFFGDSNLDNNQVSVRVRVLNQKEIQFEQFSSSVNSKVTKTLNSGSRTHWQLLLSDENGSYRAIAGFEENQVYIWDKHVLENPSQFFKR